MNRSTVLAAALVLALAAGFAQALAGPLPVRACSCMEPLPGLARVAADPATVIVAGTIGQQLAEQTQLVVDTWFHGAGMTDVLWLSFGSQMLSSCDPFVTPGERRLMVLHRQDGGLYSVNPCVSSGVIGEEGGDAALAEAEALFLTDVPATPQPPSPTEPPDSPSPSGPGDGWLFVAGTLGAAAVLFAVLALLGMRSRRPH
jgi:hypothetical protein